MNNNQTAVLKDDGMGNLIEEPVEPPKGRRSTVASSEVADKKPRKNDWARAKEVVEAWGRPLAFQAGEFWSFTTEFGWQAVTEKIAALCNQIKNGNAEQNVLKIVQTQLLLPSADMVTEPATYWERVNGIWEGKWVPFRVNRHSVLFANGVLDLQEMEFTPTENRIIYGPRITIPFDDDLFECSCEEFDVALEKAMPLAANREYFQRLMSLVLQPHVLFRGQIVAWGRPQTGKSTLMRAIGLAPAGAVGCSFVTEYELASSRWASVGLINKFANISDDSPHTRRWEPWMKGYTSGIFRTEPKFCKVTSASATAKLIATCNEFQPLDDQSGAAEQRYRAFEFENPIMDVGSTGHAEMLSIDYWCDPARRRGIVGWLLNGLVEALRIGIAEPEMLKAAKQKAIGSGNNLYQWFTENVTFDPQAEIRSSDLLDAAISDGVEVTAHSLGRMAGKFAVRQVRHDSKRYYQGIKLKFS